MNNTDYTEEQNGLRQVARTVDYQNSENYTASASLPLSEEKVPAGFPLPNGGNVESSLDLNEFCIIHPATSYIFQVTGDSLIEAGILPDDYLIVDRSCLPKNGDLVIAAIHGEFTAKFYHTYPVPQLVPANRNYSPIIITGDMECEITGVVITSFRKFRH